MKHLIRTRFGKDIVAEVQIPERQTGKIAILASGLPSTPPKRSVFDFLCHQGYVVIAFRYRGTWESGGVFLQESPAKDVELVVSELIKSGGIMDFYNQTTLPIKVKTIHLFGTSFGGPAVLLNSHLPLVSKVIALSPVLDWNEESEAEPFDFFVRFTREAFGSAYRLSSEKIWQKLLNSEIYDPIKSHQSIQGKKVFIIGASDDEVTPSSLIPEIAALTGARYYIKPKGGHLGMSQMIQKFYWNKIEDFLKKK
jgi:pimeloyl-ACP methyl ester carboxylesterase